METIDSLLCGRWVVPVVPAGALEHHAVAVHQGRIKAVLPTAEAEARFRPHTRRDLPDHLLIPGLINAHTHAAMVLMRGMADDLPLMTWLQDHIWPVEGRFVSPQFVADGVRLAAAELLRGGVTCFNDMYFFPEVTANVAREVGIRACVGLIVIDFPTPMAGSFDEHVAKNLELRQALQGDPLIRLTWAPHAPYTVSRPHLERVAALAAEHQLPVHIHVHETAFEVEQMVAHQGLRPLALLDEVGLVGPALQAVHMTQLTDGEIQRLAEAKGHVLHCPEANLKLASGFCPLARLLAAGVNVALGTDGAASNNDLDVLGEMRTAALVAKGLAGDASAVNAQQALELVTLNTARALGMADELGSLEVGKWADITAVALATPETEPVYHPVSQLVYATPRTQVTDVWVAGEAKLENRQLTSLSLEPVLAAARRWRERLASGGA